MNIPMCVRKFSRYLYYDSSNGKKIKKENLEAYIKKNYTDIQLKLFK